MMSSGKSGEEADKKKKGEIPFTLLLSHYHFHTFNFTLLLSHFHFLAFTCTLSLSRFHFHAFTFTLSLLRFHTFTFTLSLSHFHFYTFTFTIEQGNLLCHCAQSCTCAKAIYNFIFSQFSSQKYLNLQVKRWCR